MSVKPGVLLVVSGPSGAGKSTALAKIIAGRKDAVFSVSATTRPLRPGESEGVHYMAVSDGQFSELLSKNELLEWAEYAGHRYGTPAAPVMAALDAGKVIVLDIDVAGALQVAEKCTEAVLVFFTPSTLAEVERRLRDRGTETEEKIGARIKAAREEYKYIGRYRYMVINDNLDDAVHDLSAVIDAELRIVPRMGRHISDLLESV